MKKSLLYTGTGDAGTTSLVGGTRVDKISPRLEAYGTVDELNASLGVLAASWGAEIAGHADTVALLHNIQSRLFDIGAYLATPDAPDGCRGLDDARVAALEEAIDAADAAAPPMNCFVLPGGTMTASLAHVARTVCRRAERRILALPPAGIAVDSRVLVYVNRLSDYLFALARLANAAASHPEIPWRAE